MTYTSEKGKQANEARERGRGYRAERDTNIQRIDRAGPPVWCDTCGVDVGRVAVGLDPLPLHARPITICRDCATRVGELVRA